MINGRSAKAATLDAVALVAILGAGLWGFAPLFADQAWVRASVGGLVVGLVVAAMALMWRWGAASVALAVIVAYALTGGAFVLTSTTLSGAVPTLATLRGLAVGAVATWRDLLTVDVPVQGLEVVALVPFIVALVSTVLALRLGVSPKRYQLGLVAAILPLVTSAAFGTYRSEAPVTEGAIVVGAALTWLAWRRASGKAGDASNAVKASGPGAASARRKRGVMAAAVLATAVVVGTGASIVTGSDDNRDVMREVVIPPLDLKEYASPLQSFRRMVRDEGDTVLFTAKGLPASARVRLATLDAYDGVVYAVSGGGGPAAGTFSRVGNSTGTTTDGESASIEITVGALGGVWLPTVGSMSSLTFAGDDAAQLARAAYLDTETGTALVTTGLREGDTYSLTAVVADAATADKIAGAGAQHLAPLTVAGSPASVKDRAAEMIADKTTAGDQVLALKAFLSASGYFSHGLEGQAPSRSGHGAERIDALLSGDEMIGDDEQYAVAFALMANQLGIPTRVVLGFSPESSGGQTFEATGADAHVWVEVALDGLGWVPIDPAPAEDQTPEDQLEEPQREPKPQVLQPPPAPEAPPVLPPSIPTDDETIEPPDDTRERIVASLLYVAGGAGIGVLLLGPFVGLAIAKARKSRRRRKSKNLADRVVGAWLEVEDAARDLGIELPRGGTRRETALAIDERIATEVALPFAHVTDARVWAPEQPSAADVAAAWTGARAAKKALLSTRGRAKRARAALSARSLRSDRARRKGRIR